MGPYLGIDPGKGGAIAALDDEGRLVSVTPTPMLAGAGAPDYDLPGIVRLLRELDPRFVTVEELLPLPPHFSGAGGVPLQGGSKANYARGLSQGWAWMLTALGLPFLMVRPQTWQRRMLVEGSGDTKARSVLAAQRLWPGYDFRRSTRCRKIDDGMTDAALLGEHGRRVRTYTALDERAG